MRILLVIPGGVHQSGTHQVIPALISLISLLSAEHEVEVVNLGQEERAHSYTLHGARVHDLGRHTRAPGGIRLPLRVRQALRAIGPRPIDVVHGFWAGRSGLVAALIGRAKRAPVVLSVGGGELCWIPEIGYGGLGRARDRLSVGLSLQLADRLTVGSRFVETLLPSTTRAIRVPLGAASLFHREVSRPDGPPWRLVQVASINRVKDPDTLLEMMAILARSKAEIILDWAGEDTLGGEIQRRAQALGLAGAIRFLGFRTQAELDSLFASAHIYVQSSIFESQGVAVLEAACSGLPIVGTEVGILPEIAPSGAISVPTGRADRLAEGVLELIGDRGRRHDLGQAAQSFARRHSAEWTAKRFLEIYGELLTIAR